MISTFNNTQADVVLCNCLRVLKDKNTCLYNLVRLASTNQQEAESETMLVTGQSRKLPLILLSLVLFFSSAVSPEVKMHSRRD